MKIGCMQPYFFPYLGYFSLIKYADLFVIFDTPQFIRHGWIERNRIVGPKEDWIYIKVPLKKHPRNISIRDVKIRNEENWKEKVFAQLVHYKRKAPYYKYVMSFLEDVFKHETDSITHLNAFLLEKTCEYIGISFEHVIFSESNIAIPAVSAPDEWALEITKALNGNIYVNPPKGIEIFEREKYERNNINLQFLKVQIKPYDQKKNNFLPSLSIIDVMMFNSSDEICHMLDGYSIE